MSLKFKKPRRRLNPVMSTGAEYLVMGYLMRSNIQTFKAPERNEGYDLLCANPEIARIASNDLIRVQVKSRAAWDCDCGFNVKCKDGRIDVSGFDFLVAVFLNAVSQGDGKYRGFVCKDNPEPKLNGRFPVEFFVFSSEELQNHPEWMSGSRLRLSHKLFDSCCDKFMGDAGMDKIAKRLKIGAARN